VAQLESAGIFADKSSQKSCDMRRILAGGMKKRFDVFDERSTQLNLLWRTDDNRNS